MTPRRPPAAAPAPWAFVLLTSVGAAGILAVADAVWMRQTAGVGRLRDLQLLHLARRGLEVLGHQLLAVLPVWVNTPFELTESSGFLIFLGASALLYVALVGGVAAMAAFAVHRAARLYPLQAATGVREWLWREWLWSRGLPAGVLVTLAAPILLSLVHRVLNPGGDARVSVAIAGGAALLLWIALTTPAAAALRGAGACRAVGAVGLALTVAATAAGVAAAVLTADAGGTRPAPAPGLPNVLLVSIDSLRPDHLHSYGYPRQTSPAIDRLAAEGARFATVVSSSSWTLPAHVTLLSALGAEEHGVVTEELRMRPDTRTLSEVLWQAGYATAGFASGSFLDALYGFARGFDHYDDYSIVKAHEPASHEGITSPTLLQIASDWLESWDARGRTRPFFLFLHMWDVHYDFTPPAPYDRMFDPHYTGTVSGEDFEVGTQVHRGMAPRDLEHVIALYDGEIRFTDEYLGRLLEVLRTLGVLDDTVVVVTADHGEEFFEHGEKGHAKQLYDETILVPLVMRFPRAIERGDVVTTPVRLVDVAPTILSLAGVPVPAWFGSRGRHAARDLSPLLGREAAPRDPVPALADLRGRVRALRTPEFKLIVHDGDESRRELYDLAADPREHEDLARTRVDVARALADELGPWSPGENGETPHVALSREHVHRLRALGYVE